MVNSNESMNKKTKKALYSKQRHPMTMEHQRGGAIFQIR
jgi:hypothetical protein